MRWWTRLLRRLGLVDVSLVEYEETFKAHSDAFFKECDRKLLAAEREEWAKSLEAEAASWRASAQGGIVDADTARRFHGYAELLDKHAALARRRNKGGRP